MKLCVIEGALYKGGASRSSESMLHPHRQAMLNTRTMQLWKENFANSYVGFRCVLLADPVLVEYEGGATEER